MYSCKLVPGSRQAPRKRAMCSCCRSFILFSSSIRDLYRGVERILVWGDSEDPERGVHFSIRGADNDVAIAGPKKVSISRAHPFQCPS